MASVPLLYIQLDMNSSSRTYVCPGSVCKYREGPFLNLTFHSHTSERRGILNLFILL